MKNSGVLARIRGSVYNQFGKEVLSTQIRYSMLEAMFEVDHEVQRQLDPGRRLEIRNFIIKSLEDDEHFYFSPFIFSSRDGIREVDGGFELEPGSKIYILDGQHRAAALSSAIGFLKSKKEMAEETGDYEDAAKQQSYLEYLTAYPVSMQIYLNLDQQEERQLFTDCNTERKEAHRGLVMQYDQRDKYAELTRNVAKQLEDDLDIEFKSSRLTIQNAAITTLTTMRRCLIAMFEGKLTVKTGDPYFRGCKPTDVPKVSRQFFASWVNLFPKNMANRKLYVSGLTGIQIALAYTVHLLTKSYSVTLTEAIAMLKLINKQCTWRHDDAIFTHMYNPATKRLVNHSTSTAIKKTTVEFLSIIEKERRKINDNK